MASCSPGADPTSGYTKASFTSLRSPQWAVVYLTWPKAVFSWPNEDASGPNQLELVYRRFLTIVLEIAADFEYIDFGSLTGSP